MVFDIKDHYVSSTAASTCGQEISVDTKKTKLPIGVSAQVDCCNTDECNLALPSKTSKITIFLIGLSNIIVILFN